MRQIKIRYHALVAAAISLAIVSVTVFAQGQTANIKDKLAAKKPQVAAIEAGTSTGDEADTMADLDKEIAGSDGVQSAQTQMTQQGQQIVTVDRSSMPNILAAIDMVADKDVKAFKDGRRNEQFDVYPQRRVWLLWRDRLVREWHDSVRDAP
jgi:hypothetical protein